MKAGFRTALATAALVCLGGISGAETVQTALTPLGRPDPASIAMPPLPLAANPKERGDPDSYFYFHKDSVSYDEAFTDLDICRLYAFSANISTLPPKFVALGSDAITRDQHVPDTQRWYTQYGIVGGLTANIMLAIIAAEVEQDNRNATMRRCMAYKGYKRYGLSSAAFEKIDTGSDAEKLARLALFASGPQPLTKEAGQ